MQKSELVDLITQNSTLGGVVQAVDAGGLRFLRWDKGLEDMFNDNYKRPGFSLDAQKDNTLLGCYAAYMRHNGFSENFFPFNRDKNADARAVYVAGLFNEYHDFVHAICQYESSDEDELRLESFMLGQNPRAFSVFFKGCISDPQINEARYKHLRDVWEARIYLEDFERGFDSESIVSRRLEDIVNIDVDLLRSILKIPGRISWANPENTCGLKTSERFFKIRSQEK